MCALTVLPAPSFITVVCVVPDVRIYRTDSPLLTGLAAQLDKLVELLKTPVKVRLLLPFIG